MPRIVEPNPVPEGLPPSTYTRDQKKRYGPRYYTEGGTRYKIVATVRHDDECGNGRNSFSVTGSTWRQSHPGSNIWEEDAGGCIHDLIAAHFPELAPVIKWHLCSTDGPMHYVGNTTYFAGDRDCHGLRKGERRQLRNGKTGQLAWKRRDFPADMPQYIDADERPTAAVVIGYEPWERVGEGKARELDAARRVAVWPEATDAELTAPDLEQRLRERLPALMIEFKRAVESLGLVY